MNVATALKVSLNSLRVSDVILFDVGFRDKFFDPWIAVFLPVYLGIVLSRFLIKDRFEVT